VVRTARSPQLSVSFDRGRKPLALPRVVARDLGDPSQDRRGHRLDVEPINIGCGKTHYE